MTPRCETPTSLQSSGQAIRPQIFDALLKSRTVLIAGCRGGFDVVSGLPLMHWLQAHGITVVLANLSFARLEHACHERIGPCGWIVDGTCETMSYFPEKALWRWLADRGIAVPLIGFHRTGVQPLRDTYRTVLARYEIDTVLLVDGGTDSLIRGDESVLGTPEEDALSLIAVMELAGVSRYLACLGFGVDHYHGICHHSFLENAAAHLADDTFLGTVSLEKNRPETRFFLDAVADLNLRHADKLSIVSNSIANAINGRFGDVHSTYRTAGSRLFIKPLMAMY